MDYNVLGFQGSITEGVVKSHSVLLHANSRDTIASSSCVRKKRPSILAPPFSNLIFQSVDPWISSFSGLANVINMVQFSTVHAGDDSYREHEEKREKGHRDVDEQTSIVTETFRCLARDNLSIFIFYRGFWYASCLTGEKDEFMLVCWREETIPSSEKAIALFLFTPNVHIVYLQRFLFSALQVYLLSILYRL